MSVGFSNIIHAQQNGFSAEFARIGLGIVFVYICVYARFFINFSIFSVFAVVFRRCRCRLGLLFKNCTIIGLYVPSLLSIVYNKIHHRQRATKPKTIIGNVEREEKGIAHRTCVYWHHRRMTVNSQHCTQLNMNTCVSLNKFRVICACVRVCVFKERNRNKKRRKRKRDRRQLM